MGTSEEIIARIARLANGEHRVEDLDRIFIFLRSRVPNLHAVQDIGNLVAHPEDRDRGLAWKRLKDVHDSIRLGVKALRGKTLTADEMAQQLRANFRLSDASLPREKLNVSQPKARKILERIISKLTKRGTPFFYLLPVTKLEMDIVELYGGVLISDPVYSATQVFDEFVKALSLHNLISEDMKGRLGNAKSFIALYILTKMHRSKAIYSDGTTIFLNAEPYTSEEYPEPTLCIRAKADFNVPGFERDFAFPAFETECSLVEYCAPRLSELDASKWSLTPLEINRNGVVDILG